MGRSWTDIMDTPMEVIEVVRARMSAENKEKNRQNKELEKSMQSSKK